MKHYEIAYFNRGGYLIQRKIKSRAHLTVLRMFRNLVWVIPTKEHIL